MKSIVRILRNILLSASLNLVNKHTLNLVKLKILYKSSYGHIILLYRVYEVSHMVSKKELYNIQEIRFVKKDELHSELWSYLESKGRIIGKDKYLLQLLKVSQKRRKLSAICIIYINYKAATKTKVIFRCYEQF